MIVARPLISTAVAALAVLAGLLGAGAASAQGNCTMDRLARTYAFESHGSITFALAPSPPIEWSLISRPLVMLGWFTVLPDGTMSGEAWVILGRAPTVLDARPLTGRLYELDAEACTAVLEWVGAPVPGGPSALHRERLVFVDNGREFRSMLKYSPSGTMAWIGRGHRMTPDDEDLGVCGPHLLAGDVLVQCEALGFEGRATTAASMARLAVAGDGSFTGTVYSKDPVYAEAEVEGTFDVQPDCKVEATLESWSLPGAVHHGRGMIFDQGKEGFLILPFETTLPDGSPFRPALARCDLVSLGR
ncbi:MAG: hypothetical protein F9K18_06200 [Thermoanaerobaculia bacterium]|nr:MAG: hypothetical protein F9K18_06200 [Thermoanaerobaculia bacterium]